LSGLHAGQGDFPKGGALTMANTLATFSVCNALRTFLQQAYDTAPVQPVAGARFDVITANVINAAPPTGQDLVTVFLYRVTVNEHQRNLRVEPYRERVPLTLDLHLLLTTWSATARNEHALLTWTMRELYQRPVLDMSLLSAEANWQPGDAIQIVPAELSNEDMMRLWDALAPPYHVSLSYVARMLRIDADPLPDYGPVVSRRIDIEEIRRTDGEEAVT
jgi:hypothetical protein